MYVGRLDPQSNRSSFIRRFNVVDDDTGDDVDLSGLTIVFEIRACGGRVPDYSWAPYTGPLDSSALAATTGNGKITIPALGYFQVAFTASEMQTLSAQTYELGVTIADGDDTEQFIIGTLPVLNGVVTR